MSNIAPQFSVQMGILPKFMLASAVKLFGKGGQARESILDQRVEERWNRAYRDLSQINFTEIFAVRLSNYALSCSTVSCDNEDIDRVLKKLMSKSGKWCPLALGVGRVYLVPYVIGDDVYVDCIPQSDVVTTAIIGDEVNAFLCVSETKTVGKNTYSRLTEHIYDNKSKTYTVKNRAKRADNGADVPLETVPEWSDIEPEFIYTGIEQRPFGYVDSPKDNRDGDKNQGASILIGCKDTEREIRETIKQYEIEFDHKRSVLGVDRTMLDTDQMDRNGGRVAIAQQHILTSSHGRLGEGGGDLFSVYSPDIRDSAYEARLLHLFARLEKQVGTSSGILTPADTSMATATQVRRAMYDTFAMVGRIRSSITLAIDHIAYGIKVMLEITGTRVPDGWKLSYDWSDDMVTDTTEQFAQISQGHSAGVLSDIEYRRFFFPNETEEEARKALEEIAKGRADRDYFAPENADGDDGDILDNFGKPDSNEDGEGE